MLNAWVGVCRLDELRGGLRAIAEREAVHAGLLAGRLRELGAPCTAAVNELLRAGAVSRFGPAICRTRRSCRWSWRATRTTAPSRGPSRA